jgi:hypothetical protein
VAHGWASCSCPRGGTAFYSGASSQEGTGAARVLRSASVRGHGRKSTKAMANHALIDVGVGISNKLPLVIRQSFKDGRYSPSTRMEEIEWKIMLEQFLASGVVVKDEIIDIDSD